MMSERAAVSVAVEVNQVETTATEDTEDVIRRAVAATLQHESVADASISVTLLDDKRIRNMNRKYLEHDRVTDVISFPLYERGEAVVGDIYIGYEQAQEQAADANVDLSEEVARLAIHGTLHVLGYDHPEEGERTQSEMWRVQEEILRMLSASQ
jgi:probable rRNA maturation factor